MKRKFRIEFEPESIAIGILWCDTKVSFLIPFVWITYEFR